MKLYIAAKLTDPDPGVMDYYRREAIALGGAAESNGHSVFVPHRDIPEPPNLTGEALWQAAMRLCIRELLDCDGILAHPNWVHSRGARVEVHLARSLGMPVFFAVDEVAA